jgi:putative sterol carrier protein
MASTFQPTTAPARSGLRRCSIGRGRRRRGGRLFDLSGREPGQWTVQIRDQTCRVSTGRTMDPTVTLTMDSDVWLAIARGEKSGKDAFMNGEYQVDGDVMFMMRFGKIFPVK